ncbi:hypothetical protein ABVT39_026866 [Epinephelus coioides]
MTQTSSKGEIPPMTWPPDKTQALIHLRATNEDKFTKSKQQKNYGRIEGHLPANLLADLTWNRVAILTGREGGNTGLDLVNEFLNDFSEMMKRSYGRYTDQETQRCAEMGEAFGKELDRVLTNAGVASLEQSWSIRDRSKKRQIADIRKFVREFNSDGLFDKVLGRFHDGLEKFSYSTKIKNPKRMGRKMRELALEIDDWDVFAGLKPVV